MLGTTTDPLTTFTANALLTVGVAIALVGIILRVQLNIQDELDDARRARLVFEQELRAEIAVVDARVSQALEAILKEAPSRSRDEARLDHLARELSLARNRTRELEEQIKAAERATAHSAPVATRVKPERLTGYVSRALQRPRQFSFGDAIELLMSLCVVALLTYGWTVLIAYGIQQLIPASADALYGEASVSVVIAVMFAAPAWALFLGWDLGEGSLPWKDRLWFGLLLAAVAQVGVAVLALA